MPSRRLDDLLSRAEEVDPPTSPRRGVHDRLEEVDAGDAGADRLSKKPRSPDHGHAVDVDKGAGVDDVAELRRLRGLDDLVHVDRDLLMRAAVTNELVDAVERVEEREAVDPQAEEVHLSRMPEVLAVAALARHEAPARL